MKKMITAKRFSMWLILCIIVTVFIGGCKKEKYPILTSSVLNITQYLESKPDQFSLFKQILDKSGYSGFLGAYGAYTLFAPTDDGVKTYLKTVSKTSVDQLDANTCKDLVKIHLIQDTLTTSQFTDGKLPSITMYGQYLTTGAANVGGTTKVTVNRQAKVTVNRQANLVQGNVKAGNGIVHVIDNMLTPATLTLAQMIEQNPKYSIYTQALKQTGFYDTLNVAANSSTNASRKFFTVFAETDSTFNAAGISSYAALQRRYSATGNPKNPADSLYLFMAYHTVPDIKYLADVITTPSITTLAPQEVITTSLASQTIVLNETTFNNIFEPGVSVNRGYSDLTATNGVLHAANTNFTIKKRSPTAVYFDVADQPEIRKMTSVFRKFGKFVNLSYGQLADVTWDYTAAQITYTCTANTDANPYVYYDLLSFGLRFGASNVVNWIEFKTPLLVKGQYKVWICFRRGVHGQFSQVSMDGNPLSRIIDLTAYYPSLTDPDGVVESQGFKKYTGTANTTQMAELAGTVNITSTDRHTIRLQCIKANTNSSNAGATGVSLDMIQFIPLNQDQQYPRFNRDGSLITK
ncbi:MAG: fasciclin domain-containing protein [Sphingobacteriaceae bacterium]|nr:MAG: fasciclin domain-containing protein [Sphingobacteriaceae bacterium]